MMLDAGYWILDVKKIEDGKIRHRRIKMKEKERRIQ
jgi:hypothetical protein